MPYRRILLPIDGSALAESATAEAVSLAESFAAAILVLEAMDTPKELISRIGVSSVVMEEVLPITLDAERRRAHDDVRRVSDVIRRTVVRVDELVVSGQAGPAILSVAADQDCDLIVMCTHGKGGPERGKLGTVTDYVVRHSPIPVLITHAAK